MAAYIRSELNKGGYNVRTLESYDTHRSFIKYQEQLLILSRHDREEVLKGELPGVSFLRNGYVAIRLGDFWFLTSHLHFALPMIRKSQYKFIDQKFGQMKAIIFGDLNSNPESGETGVLKIAGWESYFDGPTYPSSDPTKTFDGLWMTESFHNEVLSTAMDRHFMNVRNQPSDHLGISLQILFR
jgi:endonuclease/exonuclease/phosphatase family metal-dependent hydrolase